MTKAPITLLLALGVLGGPTHVHGAEQPEQFAEAQAFSRALAAQRTWAMDQLAGMDVELAKLRAQLAEAQKQCKPEPAK